jgi:hypothetical protein
MKKKISDKILSLPPYLSTSWVNIDALKMEGEYLLVWLKDGGEAKIPGLTEEDLDLIFQAHSEYLEKEESAVSKDCSKKQEQTLQPEAVSDALKKLSKLFASGSGGQQGESPIGFPLQFGFGEGIEGMAAAMQHDPSHSNSPDLPQEVLDKIASIAQVLGKDEGLVVPEAEPHCNCFHCQVAKAIQGGIGIEVDEEVDEEIEEEVTEEDLKFRQWDIKQESDQVYMVSNPLDSNEVYHVYLGTPIGCTCGESNCEHIRSVLES